MSLRKKMKKKMSTFKKKNDIYTKNQENGTEIIMEARTKEKQKIEIKKIYIHKELRKTQSRKWGRNSNGSCKKEK